MRLSFGVLAVGHAGAPLTYSVSPVMKFAWSDATKTTAHAISSGRPNRWSGTTLLDDRVRCRQNPCDLDLFAIDHGRDLRRDLLLPVVALVDEIVEALALGL